MIIEGGTGKMTREVGVIGIYFVPLCYRPQIAVRVLVRESNIGIISLVYIKQKK